MFKTIISTTFALSLTTTAALACSPDDVQSRQAPLVAAFQTLMSVNPAKAQAIVATMQEEMAAAAAANDEEAVCGILDRALEEAQS